VNESPRVTNTIEVIDKNGEVLFLELSGSLKRLLKSSFKCNGSGLGALERVVELKMWISECISYVWNGQPSKEGWEPLLQAM
jgi:hypothetical protein